MNTVDQEIFTLKIIHVQNVCVDKFPRFLSILEIFLRKMFYSRVKFLVAGLNREIILTVNFSRSTVYFFKISQFGKPLALFHFQFYAAAFPTRFIVTTLLKCVSLMQLP